MIIEVKDNQSIRDIAVQYTGDASTAYDIAEMNGISITDQLPPGSQLYIPDDIEKNQPPMSFFKINKISPGTDKKTYIDTGRIFGYELPEQLS